MKKIVIIALALCTLTGFAQKNKSDNSSSILKERISKNPDNRAKVETKQLTLSLDLTNEQQAQVEDAFLAHYSDLKAKRMEQEKKVGKEMSNEERKQKRLDRLDDAIALKAKMKTILNEQQYAKYSEIIENRQKRMKQRK